MTKTKQRKTFTNLEVFFLMIATGCLGLGVGYGNVILAGIAVMCAFFALVSMGFREKTE